MNKKLIILGSGGYGRTVYDIAEQLGYSVTVLDDSDQEHPIPAFGNNEFRFYNGLIESKRKVENLPL